MKKTLILIVAVMLIGAGTVLAYTAINSNTLTAQIIVIEAEIPEVEITYEEVSHGTIAGDGFGWQSGEVAEGEEIHVTFRATNISDTVVEGRLRIVISGVNAGTAQPWNDVILNPGEHTLQKVRISHIPIGVHDDVKFIAATREVH